MSDCIFCKIVKKKTPAKIYYEDKKLLVFEDINPKAEVHLLIIPKKHIESVHHLTTKDLDIMKDIIKVAQDIVKEKNLSSYRLVTNVGEKAGQVVFHMHVHLMGYK